jgi:hypothetical protein
VCILTDTSIALVFLKIAPVFGHVGLFLLSLSVLLPTIATNYKNIFTIIFLSILMTMASIINFQTITYSVSSANFVIVDYQTPISFILLIANGMSYVLVLIVRIRNVSKIMQQKELSERRYILRFRFLFLHFLLVLFSLGSLISNRTISVGSLPGFTWFFPISFNFLYLAYAIFKDESFLFITASKLEGILISENNNGLVIFSKNYMELEMETDDMFANIINAFNVSLKANLQTKKNLEQIIYGDKIILSVYGELVTTFFIVSQSNLIIQSIARYVNSQFEKKFRNKLIEFRQSGIIVPQSVKAFEEEITYIRNFIPL